MPSEIIAAAILVSFWDQSKSTSIPAHPRPLQDWKRLIGVRLHHRTSSRVHDLVCVLLYLRRELVFPHMRRLAMAS